MPAEEEPVTQQTSGTSIVEQSHGKKPKLRLVLIVLMVLVIVQSLIIALLYVRNQAKRANSVTPTALPSVAPASSPIVPIP